MPKTEPFNTTLAITITIYFLAFLGITISSLITASSTNHLHILTAGALLTIIGALHVRYTVRTNREKEEQHHILTEALNKDCLFIAIFNPKGELYYADDFYKALCAPSPDSNQSHTINQLIESSLISIEDKDKLLHTIATASPLTLPCLLNQQETIHLTITPLQNRTGYTLIKGIKPENTTLLDSQTIDNVSLPCFIIDLNNQCLYANTTYYTHTNQTPGDTTHDLPNQLIPQDPDNSPWDNSTLWQGSITITTNDKKQNAHLLLLPLPDTNNRLGILLAPPKQNTLPTTNNTPLNDNWNIFVENAPIAIALLDKKGTILHSNHTFKSLTSTTENPNQSLVTIVDKDHQEQIKTILKNSTKSQQSPIDIAFTTDIDSTALLYVTAFNTTDNQDPTIICYLINTTEQKNLELRFVHSQKMQAVGQLAGGIAHDFNNLLTAIMGFCDLLLLRHPAGDQSFADIMQIKQNSTRAANLVRQLLAFSRKQTLQPELINVTDTLAELSNLIRRLIGENIELKLNHGRNVHAIRVDQGQFEQVIINLAVNARDAMTDGGCLSIQTKNVTVDKKHPISSDLIAPDEDETLPPGDYVQIDVIDTGCGIPKDKINQIFEPFFTTKEVGSGTGLGLSTVYGIINQTGGHIYVASQENQGTKFSIFLQCQEAKEEAPHHKEKQKENTATDLTGTGTIMLVEDEAPVRAFSAQALSNKGYRVLEAEHGEFALELYKEHGESIDLIITDVMMPGIDGPTMINKIREQHPDIKVIFISGYGEDAFGSSYGQDRNFNFLPKPFTLKQLAAKVKEVLTGIEINPQDLE